MIDKGTFDAIFSARFDDQNSINSMLYEIYKCLIINGKYILISMYHENIMLPKINASDKTKWKIQHEMIPYSWQSLYIREYKRLKSEMTPSDNIESVKIIAMDNILQILNNISFQKERYKLPDTSTVCHIYICTKIQ